jgi:K+-sensing histidine kinase KdpD
MSKSSKAAIKIQLAHYAIAVGAVIASFLLRYGIVEYLRVGLPPFITFFPTVMFVAVVAGLGPGLLATALIALGVDYLILPPTGQFVIRSSAD